MFGEKPSARVRMAVLKVEGGHSALFIVRSREVFGFTAHWLGARSLLCPGADCAACEQFVGGRWRGVIAVDQLIKDGQQRRHGLLEVTEGCFQGLEFLRRAAGLESLCGLRVCAFRRSRKAPLILREPEEGTPTNEAAGEVGTEVVAGAVATLYGLPSLAPGEGVSDWEPRAMVRAREMVAQAVRVSCTQ